MGLTRASYIEVSVPIEQELKDLFAPDAALVIFDIGSCEGEDSIKYSRLFPRATIYAVEALPSNLPLLQATLDQYSNGNIQIIPIALSDHKGTATFHVSSGHPEYLPVTDWDYGNKSSSLLPPDQTLVHHPWLKFEQTITVETNTLQRVCADRNIAQIDFMHIDVQGAELQVLRGAGDLLKRVKLIWMEVEAVPLYQSQPLKTDVEAFMQGYGFTKLKDTVNEVAGDQLYISSSYLSKLKLQKATSRTLKAVKKILKAFVPAFVRQRLRRKSSLIVSEKSADKVLSKVKEQTDSQTKQLYKISYSQSGEDLIIRFIFEALGIEQPSYLDIGAHDPYYISNTALLYSNGSRGINVEPDPQLFSAFLEARPNDINLNIGISTFPGEVNFYKMSTPTLNTLSKDEAERYRDESGYQIESVTKIRVDTIANILSRYCNEKFPDLLSLDVEGLDLEIIKSLNYQNSLPVVICVETISFSESGGGVKDLTLIQFLESKGYFVYADTYINTIFVQRSKWER
jgi:FkbM family methyltransferase